MTTNNKPTQLFKRDSITHLNGNGAGHAEEEANSVATEAQAALYVGVSVGEVSKMGVWIPCSLPLYRNLWILYRVSNPTRVRRDRPDYVEPRDLVAARAEYKRALTAQQAATVDTPTEDQVTLVEATNAALRKVIKLSEEYLDEHNARLCRWLARFVLRFATRDEDGEFGPWPITDIPEPNPEDAESYIPLYEQLEDLYNWLKEDGYNAALAASAKNA